MFYETRNDRSLKYLIHEIFFSEQKPLAWLAYAPNLTQNPSVDLKEKLKDF
jgi:hypothetical protein